MLSFVDKANPQMYFSVNYTSLTRKLQTFAEDCLSLFFSLTFRSEVEFCIEDFNTIGGKVPLIANVKPHGKVGIVHLHLSAKMFGTYSRKTKKYTLAKKNIGFLFEI